MKFIRFWFPVIFYSGIIFYISSIPNVTTPMSEIRFDLVLHMLLYMPFGFLAARGIVSTKTSLTKTTLVLMVLTVSLLYGLSDEFHQSFVAGRNAEILDLIADAVGGTIGGYLYQPVMKRFKS